jgi:hypothetical protein
MSTAVTMSTRPWQEHPHDHLLHSSLYNNP